MLKTGKPQSEGQAFHRRLLSEYNTDITLDNYVAYFALKPIAKEIEHLRVEIERRVSELEGHSPLQTPRQSTEESFFSRAITPVMKQRMEPFLASDAVLGEMVRRRQRLQTQFFEDLGRSYNKVKHYLITMERSLLDRMNALHQQSDTDLRRLPDSYIPSIYCTVESIVRYRALNLAAFRKIMRKFLERCACDSLELQRRIFKIDELVARSNVSQPMLDLRGVAMDLIAIYGTVFKLSYEETVERLTQYECRAGMNALRILPNSDTFFFTNTFPHHERPGNFAIRVLAGSVSVFLEKMIAEVLQCPRATTDSCCGRFANGEVSVKLPVSVRGDDTFIVQSMVATPSANLSTSTAVMELALMIHAAQLAGASRITAVIPYLAYTRNTASIAAVAELIEAMGCHHVITVDMHSEQVEGMFSVPLESISAKYEFVRFLTKQLRSEGHDFTNITIVAPNGDFLGRAKDFADAVMRYGELDKERQFVSVCTAVRRVKTGGNASSKGSPMRVRRAARTASALAGSGTEIHVADLQAVSPILSEPGQLEEVVHTPRVKVFDAATATVTTTNNNSSTTMAAAAAATGSVRDRSLHSSPLSASTFTPTVADRPVPELIAVAASVRKAASAAAAGGKDGNFTPDSETRSSSTLGIEKALRKQEEGRSALVTHYAREVTNEHENIVLVGDVRDRLCVILGSCVNEATNMVSVAKSLQMNGARRIILVATHAVLSGLARERLIDSPIELIIVTDSINQDHLMQDPKLARKLRVVPIAPLLARAIEKIHTESTLSTLFDK